VPHGVVFSPPVVFGFGTLINTCVTKKAKKVPAVKTKQYTKRLCSFEGGCHKQAKNGGVCQRHGAEVKFCSFEGGCHNKTEREECV